MLIQKLNLIIIVMAGAVSLGIFGGCGSDSTKPPILPPSPTLDIFLIPKGGERIIESSVLIGGYLISTEQDTLRSENIYFSSSPDSIGSLSTLTVITDPIAPSGFSENVRFTSSKLGRVVITAVYKDLQGDVAASDTVEILVIPNPNG